MRTVSLFLALLTVAANTAVVGAAALALAAQRSAVASRAWDAVRESLDTAALGLAWSVALVATLGSLYYSEVADFPPCRLCWYQRIAMYPLVVVLAVATLTRDRLVRRYVLPVVAIGAAISAYHYQLERFPSQESLACSTDVPCTTVWVWELHYISIPFMALSAFALIATLLMAQRAPTGGDQ